MTDPFLPPIVLKAFEAIGKGLFAHLQRDRLEKARHILVRRLAKGEYWAITDDDAAAALFTYLRAAEEGAARRNLEVIADLLATGAAEPTFAPNEFRAQARQLADLSRDEALALATLIRAHFNPATAYPDKADNSRGGFNPWELASYRIGEAGIPPTFKSRDEFWEACSGLVRTGWVKPVTGPAVGSIAYGPTGGLAKIARLVDLDAAIARAEAEGVEP